MIFINNFIKFIVIFEESMVLRLNDEYCKDVPKNMYKTLMGK